MLQLKLVPSPAFHPHLLVTLPETRPGCSYHVSLTLPDAIFLDRDELIDLWGQSGDEHARVEWELTPDVIDIERPVREHASPSVLLLSLNTTNPLDVPMHARYLRPNQSGRQEVDLLAAGDVQTGWKCGPGIPVLEPLHHDPLVVSLPTGQTSHQPLVEIATPIVIWLGWLYLMNKIWRLKAGVGKKVD